MLHTAGKVTPQPERQQLILEFSELLPRQGAQLWLAFRYNLRAGMAGFYRWGRVVHLETVVGRAWRLLAYHMPVSLALPNLACISRA